MTLVLDHLLLFNLFTILFAALLALALFRYSHRLSSDAPARLALANAGVTIVVSGVLFSVLLNNEA